ncbi:hypothetical protein Tco_1284727 [Tanacetum coccineum]
MHVTPSDTYSVQAPFGGVPIRPRLCNYSFEEWLKIIWHNNLHEYDRGFIFNKWILDSYNVKEAYAREIGNPYSRRFDEYNRVFNNEFEHLSNEYILRLGKKGHVLNDNPEARRPTYRDRANHNHVVTLLNLQQLRRNEFSLRRNHCRDKELAGRRR